MTTLTVLRKLILCVVAFLVVAGCTLGPKAHSPRPKPAARPHVDARAQQHYYDLGLRYYSKENYGEAKKAFREVIENGPNTTLGLKAQKNIRKIQQILNTLEDIESK